MQQDLRVDWAADRGHRPGTRRLHRDRCPGRTAAELQHVGPDRSDQRRDGHERDQLLPVVPNTRRHELGAVEFGPGQLRQVARWPHGKSTTYTNTPFQISYLLSTL